MTRRPSSGAQHVAMLLTPPVYSGDSILAVLREPPVRAKKHLGPSVLAGCVNSAETNGCCGHGLGSA